MITTKRYVFGISELQITTSKWSRFSLKWSMLKSQNDSHRRGLLIQTVRGIEMMQNYTSRSVKSMKRMMKTVIMGLINKKKKWRSINQNYQWKNLKDIKRQFEILLIANLKNFLFRVDLTFKSSFGTHMLRNTSSNLMDMKVLLLVCQWLIQTILWVVRQKEW